MHLAKVDVTEAAPVTIDGMLMRKAMGTFATGVTVVTFFAGGEPAGMTANAFMSVSLDPALVVVSVRKQSRFNEWVKKGVSYGVNILVEDQLHMSSHFGGKHNPELVLPFEVDQDAPLLTGSMTHVIARTRDIHDAGDHFLYVGEVQYLHTNPEKQPLLFFSGAYGKLHAPKVG
ncbi:flavin reductase family protein [Pseudomonas cyclaminis]|uniref:flavin reductase family protein n=1 Tax=Pseudomonas cyclaminis TaxID=2781239 RepID=UPI0019D68884|nr:flavin reductase family protein [Pseudomonas cyclaminis]